jgi:hypothetical protein
MASLPEATSLLCQICYDEIPFVSEKNALVSLEEVTLGDGEATAKTTPPNWHGCQANSKFCGDCATQYLKVGQYLVAIKSIHISKSAVEFVRVQVLA